jgi:predicted phosphodiesterase
MRYGVLADIHGNLHALRAVLDALEELHVDGLLCAGDVVGYGPQPNECVELLADLGVVTVAGNHDLMALGVLGDDRCDPLARETMGWTRAALDPASRRYLQDLPTVTEVPDVAVVAHGSLDDPQAYVRDPAAVRDQLERSAATHPGADTLVLGHTHVAFASDGIAALRPACDGRRLQIPGRWVVNPGAVGQSRERRIRACFLVMDAARREVTFHAVRYDVGACRRELRRRGLPAGAVHLPPWRARAVVREARAAGGRLRAGVGGGPG